MPNKPIQFLLVDDIHENLVALEALLRRDGLEIHKAQSAAEALELMLVNDYALALLDVHMPETDGYELAELMRGAERTRRLPIIFVTAAEVDDTRRFRGYEAGAVDSIFKPIDPVVLKSKSEVFFQLGQQARDLARQRDEMRAIALHRDQAMARLKAHADNSPLAMVELDCGLVFRAWSHGAERIFGYKARDVLGKPIAEVGWLPEATIAELQKWISEDTTSDAAPRYTTEALAYGTDQRQISCEIYGSSLCEAGTKHKSLTLQILDVTERRQAEEMRSLLIGELNHRIKNTLANVQAIARQTLRQSASLEQFDQSFSGRLQALARAHSILSDATWSSAPLDDLIDDQIKAGTLAGDRLKRSGPPVQISPENMLRLALTFHELGTNAQKYGALSGATGEVDLSWTVEGDGLILHWQERGGPTVVRPAKSGFGLTLISASAGGADGTVQVDWKPEGVHWTIRFADGITPVAGAAPAPKAAAPARLLEDTLQGRRVLLIEDEPLVALDLTCELEDVGAEIVAVARTLRDALIAAEQQSVDLALLDGNLGGDKVDGVAEILRRRGIPFCFVSGYGPEHLPADFQTVPMVQKPVDPKKLLAVLHQMIADQPVPEPI